MEWQEEEGRTILTRPKPTGTYRWKLRPWLTYFLSTPRIRLDERSSRVWHLLDGQRSVAEIAEELRLEFGNDVEPAEERTCELIRALHIQEVVAYPGIDHHLPETEECV